MRSGLDPFSFLVVCVAGWINRREQQVIEYLIEENRVLREQIGKRRMRFSDNPALPPCGPGKKAQPQSIETDRDNRDTSFFCSLHEIFRFGEYHIPTGTPGILKIELRPFI